MKNNLNLLRNICLIFLTILIYGCNAGGSSSSPTTTPSSSEPTFADQVNSINTSSRQLSNVKHEMSDYYSKVQIVKTITTDQYIVDCVPFDQQPALINKDVSIKSSAYNPANVTESKLYMKNIMSVTSSFDFKPNECPYNTVGVSRPVLQNLRSGNINAFNKVSVNHYGIAANTENYNWAQAVFKFNNNINTSILIPSDATSYIARFSGFDEAQAIINQPDQSHIINQMWLTTHAGSGDADFMSIEAGLIISSYFTNSSQPTLFIYSTTDDYNTGCYNLGCGMFVQYPNTPSLGTPVDPKNHFAIKLRVTDIGYEVDLYPSNANEDKFIAIGYYPYSNYSNLPPTQSNPFRWLSVGAEIYRNNPRNQLRAGGIIHGVGFDSTILEMTEVWRSDENVINGLIHKYKSFYYASFY